MIRHLKSDIARAQEGLVEDDEPQGTALQRAGSCSGMLGRLLLDETMTPEIRQRVATERGIAVLVEAPTAAWVPALRKALNHVGSWTINEGRDGSSQNRRRPSDGAAELIEAVGAGQRVAVVCHAPEAHVPPAFIAAADVRLAPGRPTAALVAASIRALTGRTPRRMPARVEDLDLPDLAAALRSGAGGASGCVRRLERALAGRVSSSAPPRDVPLVHDMHGMGEAGLWARQLVEDFRSMPEGRFWREADRTCMISGDPGLGKTSLVHSLARSMDLQLFEVSVSRWFEGSGYLDRTMAALVEDFSKARAKAREGRGVILFADEADGMPRREDGGGDRNSSYWQPLQQAYLREIEATAAAGVRVVLIGATNFPGRLDPAVLRPGRFGRLLRVPRPDAAALAGILRQHLGDDLAREDLSRVAEAGQGATGADVTAWVKGARRAARVAGRPMDLEDLLAEVLPPEDRSAEDQWRCAVHESSHAVVTNALASNPVLRISIVSSGRRGGSTVVGPSGTQTLGRDGLQALVISALAGRAGEEEFGLGPTTGAHDDLTYATGVAASARASFGLGGTLVQRATLDRAAALLEGDAELRAAVGRDMHRAYLAARECVRANRTLVEALARLLVEQRVVDGQDFLRLVEAHDRAVMEASHG